MDPKTNAPILLAPGAGESSALRLPAKDEPPPVDEFLDPPEVTRYERLGGRRYEAMPANPEHADPHFILDQVLAAHLREGYVGSTDLKTRVSEDDEFASDTCIRKAGVDENGHRHLEELSFEIVNKRSKADTDARAKAFAERGVRRQIAIFAEKGEVYEWSTKSQGWRLLDPRRSIKDPSLVRPLEVRALLDAGRAEIAAARALKAKNNPVIVEVREEGRAEGREEGRQGQATLVLQLIEKRFGPQTSEIKEHVLNATLDDLITWANRILDASTIEEVLV